VEKESAQILPDGRTAAGNLHKQPGALTEPNIKVDKKETVLTNRTVSSMIFLFSLLDCCKRES